MKKHCSLSFEVAFELKAIKIKLFELHPSKPLLGVVTQAGLFSLWDYSLKHLVRSFVVSSLDLDDKKSPEVRAMLFIDQRVALPNRLQSTIGWLAFAGDQSLFLYDYMVEHTYQVQWKESEGKAPRALSTVCADLTAVGCVDGTIKLISLKTRQIVRTLKGYHSKQVVGFMPIELMKKFVSGSAEGAMACWNLESDSPEFRFNGGKGKDELLAICPAATQYHFFSLHEGKVILWNVLSCSEVKRFKVPSYKQMLPFSSWQFPNNSFVLHSKTEEIRLAQFCDDRASVQASQFFSLKALQQTQKGTVIQGIKQAGSRPNLLAVGTSNALHLLTVSRRGFSGLFYSPLFFSPLSPEQISKDEKPDEQGLPKSLFYLRAQLKSLLFYYSSLQDKSSCMKVKSLSQELTGNAHEVDGSGDGQTVSVFDVHSNSCVIMKAGKSVWVSGDWREAATFKCLDVKFCGMGQVMVVRGYGKEMNENQFSAWDSKGLTPLAKFEERGVVSMLGGYFLGLNTEFGEESVALKPQLRKSMVSLNMTKCEFYEWGSSNKFTKNSELMAISPRLVLSSEDDSHLVLVYEQHCSVYSRAEGQVTFRVELREEVSYARFWFNLLILITPSSVRVVILDVKGQPYSVEIASIQPFNTAGDVQILDPKTCEDLNLEVAERPSGSLMPLTLARQKVVLVNQCNQVFQVPIKNQMLIFAVCLEQGLVKEAMDLAFRLEPRFHYLIASHLTAKNYREMTNSLFGVPELFRLELELDNRPLQVENLDKLIEGAQRKEPMLCRAVAALVGLGRSEEALQLFRKFNSCLSCLDQFQ